MACKLDYDDQANEWLKEVTPKVQLYLAIDPRRPLKWIE